MRVSQITNFLRYQAACLGHVLNVIFNGKAYVAAAVGLHHYY